MPDEKPTLSALEQLVSTLRRARLQRDLSVEDAGRLVKIRGDYIEKLEAGDFSFLPPLYVYFYLRKYAVELGVASEEQLQACRKELGVPLSRFSAKPTPAAEASASDKQLDGAGSKRNVLLIVAGSGLVLTLLLLAALLLR